MLGPGLPASEVNAHVRGQEKEENESYPDDYHDSVALGAYGTRCHGSCLGGGSTHLKPLGFRMSGVYRKSRRLSFMAAEHPPHPKPSLERGTRGNVERELAG